MKLAALLENESTELAKDYIDYANEEELSGTRFSDRKDVVVIWQDTETIGDDAEDQDAEPSKYIIVKKDVPIGILNQFMQVVKANS